MTWTAALLGIDLAELERERPDHPDQVALSREHTRKAELYWSFRRHELPPDDEWVTVAEAARATYYHKATIYGLIRKRLVESRRRGNGYVIRAKDLEVYTRSRHARA